MTRPALPSCFATLALSLLLAHPAPGPPISSTSTSSRSECILLRNLPLGRQFGGLLGLLNAEMLPSPSRRLGLTT